MKKVYVAPQMDTFALETRDFLATSASVDIVTGDFTGDFNSRELDVDDIISHMN